MKTFTRRGLLAAVVVALLLLPTPSASPAHAANTISVTGDAAVMVVPDEVVLILGIQTNDRDLLIAKSENDAVLKKLTALTQQLGVDPKYVQTDFVRIQPRYSDGYTQQNFVAFFVQKTVKITLKDTAKFEDMLTGALLAGVNYVHGIDFRTTELRKYRDQARDMAIKAAREKAEALAGALGQQVTRPTNIQENRLYSWSSYGSWWGGGYGSAMSQNVVQNAGGGPSGDDASSIALGQISVNASVTVTFELAPKSS
jgi:uncharacterized protein YggE